MQFSKYHMVDAKISADTSAVAIYASKLCWCPFYMTSDAPIHNMTAVSTQSIHVVAESNILPEIAQAIVEYATAHGIKIVLHENAEEPQAREEIGPHWKWDRESNYWRADNVKKS